MYSISTLLQECSFMYETDLQADLTELQYSTNDPRHLDDILEDEIYFYDDKDDLRYK